MKDLVFREVDRVDRMAAKVAMETERLKKLKVKMEIIFYLGGGEGESGYRTLKYSVMQSDGNNFCGDVVWTPLTWYTVMKTTFKDQKHEKRIFRDLYCEDFKF